MQTRRVFLFNGLVNLATFTVSGSLVMAGKEHIKEEVKPNEGPGQQESENPALIPKKHSDKVRLPSNTVNHAADFALGGTLGLVVKKVIEKSTKLNRVNKELSSIISKLQKLENNDLPGIERTLKEFVEKEGIRYETRNSSNSIGSIVSLLDAILIHVNSYKKATQPYLEELQKLRIAFAGPFIEQLQNVGNVDAATREAAIQVLRSDKLIEYLATTIVNALQSTGAGNGIGINIASSLEGKDLLSNDAVIALKQVVIEVMRSNQVREALGYSIGANITEYDVAERLMETLLHRYKISLQDDDPDLIALKKAIAEALKKEDVSKKLGDAYTELS